MLLESTKAAITKYCRYQERCHSETKSKLVELGCNRDEADEYIVWLISEGILNEERFARAFARGKFRMLGWGRDKIKQQLKLKKVSDYCIKSGFSEIDEAEYEEKLGKLVEKKIKDLKSEKNKNIKKQKIFRYIVQKGYEKDLILNILAETIL